MLICPQCPGPGLGQGPGPGPGPGPGLVRHVADISDECRSGAAWRLSFSTTALCLRRGQRSVREPAGKQHGPEVGEKLHGGPEQGGGVRVCGLYR